MWVLGIWKSGGFGLGRWDLGIALPRRFRDLRLPVCGFWVYGNCEREKFNIINIFIDFIVYTIKSINLFP